MPLTLVINQFILLSLLCYQYHVHLCTLSIFNVYNMEKKEKDWASCILQRCEELWGFWVSFRMGFVDFVFEKRGPL